MMDLFALSSIGLAVAAFSIGMIGKAWVESIARNPEAASKMFTPGIIALALAEFVALLCFVIALVK